jgi:ribA/ribD-fused uncharacterized protein
MTTLDPPTIVLFYKSTDQKTGYLSQWYLSPFRDENGVEYNCAEQYMMAEKAKLFHDNVSLKKIMAERNPICQKQLGRTVSGFCNRLWLQHRENIVKKANRLKFQQHPDLMQRLCSTRGLIAEASPSDVIWGIGMSKYNLNVYDSSKWKGLNLLGNILTSLRDEFRRQL